MPRPLNERQSLEQELAELRGQIAAHRNELVIMVVNKARRDRLEQQIGERARRLAEVKARLAKIGTEIQAARRLNGRGIDLNG